MSAHTANHISMVKPFRLSWLLYTIDTCNHMKNNNHKKKTRTTDRYYNKIRSKSKEKCVFFGRLRHSKMFYCMGIISDSSFDPKFDGNAQMKLTLIYLHIQTYIRFVILTNNNSSNQTNLHKTKSMRRTTILLLIIRFAWSF